MSNAFKERLNFNADLSRWDTSNVTNMVSMFHGATSIAKVSLPETGAVTTMSGMFRGATSLNSVSLPKTGAVQTMYSMFNGATSIASVSLPETGAVTNMSYMFNGATSIASVSLPKTGAVQNMSFMFKGATSLTSVSLPETGNVTSMEEMFEGAAALTSVSLPKTGNVTSMLNMFRSATKLSSVSFSDTSSVTNMSLMFWQATSLTSVSLPHTGNVTNMYGMFIGATSLTSVSLPETGKVTSMFAMFGNAASFNQDIRGWDVSAVTDFEDMFSGATAMISNFRSTPNWPADNETPTAAWFTAETTVPTISSVSLNAANNALTVTFSENVYNTKDYNTTLCSSCDLEVSDFALSISGGNATVAATPTSITKTSQKVWVLGFSIVGTANGSEVLSVVPASATSIYDAAVNAVSTTQSGNTANLTLETTTTAFANELTKINAKIASFAQAELNNLSSTMSGISSTARGRFISKSTCLDLQVSSSDPEYSGGFTASGGKIDTNLTMTKSSKSYSSEYCTYSSADVFFNRNEDDSLSRGAAGQIQFERMLSDKTMLGYFVGGSIGLMNEAGTLTTSMQAVGLKLGSYFVRELEGNIILDGYASVVTSSNDLRFTTDLMTAKSNYNTQAGAVGLNLTGIIPLASVEIRPTGSLSLTRSIGQTVNFDVSVGSASSTETATRGSITQSKLSFAPEVRMPFSQTSFGGSSVATFTPKVTCQEVSKTTTTRNCGQGIALGIDTISKDGLTNIIVGTSFDQMGGQSSTSIELKVMKQW